MSEETTLVGTVTGNAGFLPWWQIILILLAVISIIRFFKGKPKLLYGLCALWVASTLYRVAAAIFGFYNRMDGINDTSYTLIHFYTFELVPIVCVGIICVKTLYRKLVR